MNYNANKLHILTLAGFITCLGVPVMSYASPNYGVEASLQDEKITGTVTDEKGEPIIGAGVKIVGQNKGTVTDIDGHFSLNVKRGEQIEVSYLGYDSQTFTVTAKTSYNITLKEGSIAMNEVVVTALGIKREKKALGYAMQELKGSSLVESRENNVANALSGKISGLQVIKSSSGPAGSSKIVLRGNRSLTGSNQPLIVVDGVPVDNFTGADNNDYWNPSADMGNGLSDINPEDIESMSVLKGASAAALYGSRAGNGVILITTKQGRETPGLGITVSSTLSLETIFTNPRMQNSFGQGTNNVYDNRSNFSWGPALDGKDVENWNGNTVPYQAYDNVANYFGTGVNATESVSFQQQVKKTSVYTSITRTDDKSMIPGAKLNRTNITARAVSKLGKNERLTLDTKVQYINSTAKNRPFTGVNSSNAFYTMYLLPRSMDITQFNPPLNNEGKMIWYGGSSQVNPYWGSKYNINQDTRDRFLMAMSLKYEFTDWLNLELRGGSDMYWTKEFGKTYAGSPLSENGKYSEGNNSFYENNYSFLWVAQKPTLFGKFGGSATFGGNLMMQQFRNLKGSAGELQVPNLFAINNSVNNPTISESFRQKKINSLYGSIQLNWDGYLFLDATFRNDWSSTLSPENRSYFYPSLSLSYVFSDMMEKVGITTPSWLTYGKLRGSYAEVGNDLGPYQLYNTYWIDKDISGVTTAGLGNVLYNPDVLSELIKSWEVGAEFRFFNSRLGLDFAWYKTNATRQLIDLPMDPLSGYKSRKINAGDIQNTGVEIQLNGRILDNPQGVNWDMTANFSRNNNTVKSLTEGVNRYGLGGFDDVQILAIAGEKYGQIYGTTFKRVDDPASPYYQMPIVSDGLYQVDTEKKLLGNQQATALLGLTNSFTYKNFGLSFLLDMRFGGKIFSGTNQTMQLYGTSNVTAPGGQRPKVVIDGVESDGKGGYLPNTKEVSTEDYWRSIAGQGNVGIVEANIYDASNVRLRNIQLTYDFPSATLRKTPFQRLKLGVSCNNVWLISSHMNGIDPESVFATGTNAVGFENATAPTSRSYIFNLTVGF